MGGETVEFPKTVVCRKERFARSFTLLREPSPSRLPVPTPFGGTYRPLRRAILTGTRPEPAVRYGIQYRRIGLARLHPGSCREGTEHAQVLLGTTLPLAE